jgi:hypothetical protein
MPVRPRCSSLPSQTAPNASGEPNARGRPGARQNRRGKLQQRLRRAAVLQARDRLVLLRGQRRRDRDAPQQRRRHRKDQIVALELRHPTPLLHACAHAAPAVRYGDKLGAQADPVAEERGEGGREPIVSALDAVHPAARGIIARELIDERQQRELVWIREEEAPQGSRGRPQLGVRIRLVEPLRHGSAGDVGGDGRIPAPLRQHGALDQRGEHSRHPIPPSCAGAAHDAGTVVRVWQGVAPAVAEDAGELQPEILGQAPDLALGLVDHVAAGLRVLRLRETIARGQDAAADPVSRVDHGHGGAERREIARCREAGQPGAGHQHGDTS